MFAVAMSSFKEAYRKRIFHLIGLLTLIYLILLGYIMTYVSSAVRESSDIINAFTQLSSVVSVLGFYFSSMISAFLTIMISIGIISSELENGTILTVLTKPIRRKDYILGKYFGTGVIVALYAAFLYISVVVISIIGKFSLIEKFGIINLSKGLMLFMLQPLTILALAIFGGIIFKTLSNGIFVISIYSLGTIGGVMEQIGGIADKSSLATVGILSSLVSPFDVIYRKTISSIFSGFGGYNLFLGIGGSAKSTTPSIWMMVYVLIYLLFFIAIAARKFERKDI